MNGSSSRRHWTPWKTPRRRCEQAPLTQLAKRPGLGHDESTDLRALLPWKTQLKPPSLPIAAANFCECLASPPLVWHLPVRPPRVRPRLRQGARSEDAKAEIEKLQKAYEELDQRSKLILRLVLVLSGLDLFLSL